LSGRLDEQLKKWNAIKQDDLPKVTELIKQADLPALIIKENKEGRSPDRPGGLETAVP